jgi:predicted aconitase
VGALKPSREMMCELLEALRKGSGASDFVTVEGAHISGVSYDNIGDAGREFLEDLADAGVKARIRTTVNPGCASIDSNPYGIDERTIRNQRRIVRAFRRMGVNTTLSCTPYEERQPLLGEHIAWAESSAVIYANSICGARSNRESGISALAAAVTGKSPNYGMHIKGNRAPQVRVEVEAQDMDEARAGALGYLLGTKIGSAIPYVSGVAFRERYKLKELLAAASTAAPLPLVHIEGITAEMEWGRRRAPQEVEYRIGREEIEEMRERLSCDSEEPDCVLLGCPHLSIEEMSLLVRGLGDRKFDRPVFLLTCRRIATLAKELGFVKRLEGAGAAVMVDSCILWSGLKALGLKRPATNSAKACFYLRNSMGLRPRLCSIGECLRL